MHFMDNNGEIFQEIEKQPESKQNNIGRNIGLVLVNLVVIILVGLVFFWAGTLNTPEPIQEIVYEVITNTAGPEKVITPSLSPTQPVSQPQDPTSTATNKQTPTPLPTVEEFDLPNGLIFLSLVDDGYTQIFAYHPANFGMTRLTSGSYEHRDPAVSPDGSKIAYTANPEGKWDLYILDILSGVTTQITNDLAYDGSPSWSDDSAWLVYEKYIDNNLEIYIKLADDENTEEIRLTINDYPDFDPAWSPAGGKIAFTRNLGGGFDIWVADLDIPSEDRFFNITQNPAVRQGHPAWSADGKYLAWSSEREGYTQIYALDYMAEGANPVYVGDGTYPVWAPQGQIILSPFKTAENEYLAGYHAITGERVLPPVSIPTMIDGLSWGTLRLPEPLPQPFVQTSSAVFKGVRTAEEKPAAGGARFGRQLIIPIPDIDAPHPELSALVIESFFTLRDRVEHSAGWDVFASLENAFVPFNESLNPGFENSWLYTGRAIALHKTLEDAGWLLIVREDIGDTTYWRIFVRALNQDGSQGMPLKELAWDFDLRFSGDPELYEDGGGVEGSIHHGYWVDLTWLANSYGWERTPADAVWRRYISATQFNIFVIKDNLSWHDAMSQIYPPEILLTPTFIPTYTPTPTRTPWPTQGGSGG